MEVIVVCSVVFFPLYLCFLNYKNYVEVVVLISWKWNWGQEHLKLLEKNRVHSFCMAFMIAYTDLVSTTYIAFVLCADLINIMIAYTVWVYYRIGSLIFWRVEWSHPGQDDRWMVGLCKDYIFSISESEIVVWGLLLNIMFWWRFLLCWVLILSGVMSPWNSRACSSAMRDGGSFCLILPSMMMCLWNIQSKVRYHFVWLTKSSRCFHRTYSPLSIQLCRTMALPKLSLWDMSKCRSWKNIHFFGSQAGEG